MLVPLSVIWMPDDASETLSALPQCTSLMRQNSRDSLCNLWYSGHSLRVQMYSLCNVYDDAQEHFHTRSCACCRFS